MKLIVGLGNITNKYELTRHNIGFMFIDDISDKNNLDFKMEKKFNAMICKTKLFDQDVIFAKPQTYMNLSGTSVQKIANFYSIEIEDILVIYDDIDQEFGKVKPKLKSSHGGHNGIRNIINLLGTNAIPRLKIGIGRNDYIPTDKWVLSKFTKKEITELQKVFNENEEFIYNFIKFNFNKACNEK